MTLRILSWNVNGIRAITQKVVYNGLSFWEYIESTRSDIVCMTEMKIDDEKIHDIDAPSEYQYMYHSHADKKGYSGVSVYSKVEPLDMLTPPHELDIEGRLVVLEFKSFILIALYQPNAGSDLKRLSYRKKWDNRFRKYVSTLESRKGCIIVGDMNVANEDVDIFKPETHHGSAGFTDSERDNFKVLLSECKLVDVWRYIHPRTVAFTYFDYRSRARKYNRGWRIDYTIASRRIVKRIRSCDIYGDVTGSDHVPIITVYSFGKRL